MKLFRSRHARQRMLIQRRTFLAAVGLGISVPVAMKMSRLAVAQTTGRPTRLFIYFVPHGVPVEHYDPGDGALNLAVGEGILTPLEPYKQHLTMLRGVSNVVMSNHESIRSVLTGGDDVHDSIDYVIANELKTTAHVLGTMSYRGGNPGPDHDCKLVRHGAYVTPIQNPADALDDLFAGLAAGGGGSVPVVGDADFRQEALSLTIGEVEELQGKVASITTESNKLQIHLESLRALKEASSGAGQVISCETRPEMPSVTALAGADSFAMSNFSAIIDGHLEAVANAFICGSARVATLQNMHANAQLDMAFPGGPGIAGNHHDPLSHSNDEAGRVNFAICQRWFYQRLADKFIAALDVPDPQDPAHTVLENTTILTCSEIIDGNSHASAAGEQWLNLSSGSGNRYTFLPWNIIGGGGGAFTGGRVVTLQGLDHRQVLAAVARSMGVDLSTFGGETINLPPELFA